MRCRTRPSRTLAFIRGVAAVVVVVGVSAVPVATAEPVFTVLHEFVDTQGPIFPSNQNPHALIQGRNGNFYGTINGGGDTGCGGRGCGTIFMMTPAGAVTTLHVFNGPTDGANPTTLIEAADGHFYGTTRGGGGSGCGGSGCGTIFRMTPAGAFTVLHAFNGGLTDGALPSSPLLQATDGNFYGMTAYGGSTTQCETSGNAGCGTVFKLTPAGAVTILHAFVGGATDGDNSGPLGNPSSILQGTDGNFYGTTPRGGGTAACGQTATEAAAANQSCGTVFRMTPVGDVTILHAFRGGTTDGAVPTSLIQVGGDFYGTTYGGGRYVITISNCTYGCGTIFKMTPDGTITLLHIFDTDSLGTHPNVLVQASDGNFYGTTSGQCFLSNCLFGAVFKMTPAGTIISMHEFSNTAVGGAFPHALIQGADGNLYGATYRGCRGVSAAPCSMAAVFRLTGVNPSASDDLVVDFGLFGVWMLFDNTGQWAQLHTATARNIATGDLDGNGIDEVILDFGPASGIWVWANDSVWYQLHTSTASRIVTGDLDGNGQAEVLIDFPGSGIWVWANDSSWFRLHRSSANNLVTADLDGNGSKEAIIDFPGFGLWVWTNNTSWYQLHPVNSRLITAGDFDGNGQADLIVDFAGYGLWNYSNNNTWSQVHPFSASHLAAGDVDGTGQSDLIVDFGSPYGIWVLLNSTSWSQLHTLTSTNILTADLDGNGQADVIINFGAAGLWEYANNMNWFQLHTVSPGVIAVGHINAP